MRFFAGLPEQIEADYQLNVVHWMLSERTVLAWPNRDRRQADR